MTPPQKWQQLTETTGRVECPVCGWRLLVRVKGKDSALCGWGEVIANPCAASSLSEAKQ